MEILGYILAVVVGVSLGLIGSGGSILTVPDQRKQQNRPLLA